MLQSRSRTLRTANLQSLTANTYTSYLRTVTKFLKDMALPVSELSYHHVREYLAARVTSANTGTGKLSPQTYNAYHAALTFFFEVTLERDVNRRQVPRMKLDKKLPLVLTKEQVKSLFAVCDDIKYKAIFSIAYGSGLRACEIINLRAGDIRTRDGERRIYIEKSKNRQARYALLSDSTLTTLRTYWKRMNFPNDANAYLFPGDTPGTHITYDAVNMAIQRYSAEAGLPHVTLHTLRHSFATHMYEGGTEIPELKKLMGHKALASTLLYVRIADTYKGIVSPMDSLNDPS